MPDPDAIFCILALIANSTRQVRENRIAVFHRPVVWIMDNILRTTLLTISY